MMKMSINSTVKVKLTGIGEELLRKSRKLPKKDSNGYVKLRFIELLTMFSEFEYLGDVNQPFTGDIIIID